MKGFTSRKFILALGAFLSAVGAGLSGTLPWNEVADAVTLIVLGYFAAEGAPDAAGALGNALRIPTWHTISNTPIAKKKNVFGVGGSQYVVRDH